MHEGKDWRFILGGPKPLCIGNLQVNVFLLRLARFPEGESSLPIAGKCSGCWHFSRWMKKWTGDLSIQVHMPPEACFLCSTQDFISLLGRKAFRVVPRWEKGSHKQCEVRKKSYYSLTVRPHPLASYSSPSLTPCSEGTQCHPVLSSGRFFGRYCGMDQAEFSHSPLRAYRSAPSAKRIRLPHALLICSFTNLIALVFSCSPCCLEFMFLFCFKVTLLRKNATHILYPIRHLNPEGLRANWQAQWQPTFIDYLLWSRQSSKHSHVLIHLIFIPALREKYHYEMGKLRQRYYVRPPNQKVI